MTLRKQWQLVVVVVSVLIACRTEKTPPPPPPPPAPAAVMEYKGETLVAIPVAGGNVLVIRAADAQFCPKGQGNATCLPRALVDAAGHGCPTCEGCNCRLPTCSQYCMKAFAEYLDGHYTSSPPIPGPPPPPQPVPAPQ